jgi:hypothetical protein
MQIEKVRWNLDQLIAVLQITRKQYGNQPTNIDFIGCEKDHVFFEIVPTEETAV